MVLYIIQRLFQSGSTSPAGAATGETQAAQETQRYALFQICETAVWPDAAEYFRSRGRTQPEYEIVIRQVTTIPILYCIAALLNVLC